MSTLQRNVDQAKDLREQVKVQTEQEEIRRSSLPPRSEVHKHRKTKKKKLQIHYPVVRLLALLFFVIVILAFAYPYWLEKL